MKTFENFGKYLPLLTLLVLFSSSLQLWWYYFFFHVDIFDYINLSELSLKFLQSFLWIFLLMVYQFIQFELNPFEHINIPKRKKSWRWEISFLIILSILFFILIVSSSYMVVGYYLFISLAGYFIIRRVVKYRTILRRYFIIKRKTKAPVAKSKRRYIHYSTSFITLYTLLNLGLIFFSSFKYSNLRYNIHARSTCVKLKDRVIDIKSNEFYIGKTEKYLFLFNSKLNQSAVIPIEEVLEIHDLRSPDKKIWELFKF